MVLATIGRVPGYAWVLLLAVLLGGVTGALAQLLAEPDIAARHRLPGVLTSPPPGLLKLTVLAGLLAGTVRTLLRPDGPPAAHAVRPGPSTADDAGRQLPPLLPVNRPLLPANRPPSVSWLDLDEAGAVDAPAAGVLVGGSEWR